MGRCNATPERVQKGDAGKVPNCLSMISVHVGRVKMSFLFIKGKYVCIIIGMKCFQKAFRVLYVYVFFYLKCWKVTTYLVYVCALSIDDASTMFCVVFDSIEWGCR